VCFVVLDSTDGYFLVRFDFKRVIVMNDWQMLTLVGRDQEGIVAAVTEQLSKNGCQLGQCQKNVDSIKESRSLYANM